MNDLDKLLAYAIANDWELDVTGKHYKVTSPEGKLVVCPKTASDYRSIKNTIGDFRRAGLPVPHKVTPRKRVSENYWEVAHQICVGHQLDTFVAPFPHITEILGRCRNRSWFDEKMCVSEAAWPGPDEHQSAEIMLANLVPNGGLHTQANGLRVLMMEYPTDNAGHVPNPKIPMPSMRKRRIMLDASRFWIQGIEKEDWPYVCTCGYTSVDDSIGSEDVFNLAEHIVQHQERADLTHIPCGEVFMYAPPEDLERMFDPDDRDILIEKLTSENQSLRNDRANAWDIIKQIRRIVK